MVTDEQFNEMAQTVQELATSLTTAIFQLRAADDAFVALFSRYAQRLGVSSEQIVSEYQVIYQAMHERILLKTEESNPSIAALLDSRPIEGLESDVPPEGKP